MKIERFGKITLINGDCMEYMRECKDKHFDVLVADPPYGDANFQNPPSEEIAAGEGNCLAREARGLRNTSASHRIRSLTGRFGRYSRELPPRNIVTVSQIQEYGGMSPRLRNTSTRCSVSAGTR